MVEKWFERAEGMKRQRRVDPRICKASALLLIVKGKRERERGSERGSERGRSKRLRISKKERTKQRHKERHVRLLLLRRSFAFAFKSNRQEGRSKRNAEPGSMLLLISRTTLPSR